MSKQVDVRKSAGCWTTVGLWMITWLVTSQLCHAQANRLVAPAPIGSPQVPVGPVANPYGQPPMAIGPAPGTFVPGPPLAGPPQIVIPPVYNVPAPPFRVLVQSNYPLQPPPLPYSVRRPTPFDGPAGAPAPVTPGQIETRYQAGAPLATPGVLLPPSGSQTPIVPPAPIGNLRLTVSERFLNRLIARDDQRPGDVQDFILGAKVTGRQMTNTSLRLDLVPCADKIRGFLVLNGTTHSQTTGVTPQAMIDTASEQQFFATKEVLFDGMGLSTRHATVHVQARNKTLGAVTPFSGTLIGGIADRIAYREALRRQPEAEAIARDKVAERVYPEFDSEIDKNLGWANDQLESSVRRGLRLKNVMPSQQQTSSTDESLTYCALIGNESVALSNPKLDCLAGSGDGVCMMVHESLFNALIQTMGMKGLKTTDKQIKALFAPYEVKSAGDDLDNSKPPISIPGLTNLTTDVEFDETDPLTIHFDTNRTVVTLRAHFKPAGQTVIPPLAVKIEYTPELIGNQLVVTPGKPQVSVVDNEDAESVTPLTLSVLSQAIEASLTKLAFDRTLPAAWWPLAGSVPKISAIRSEDGWAAISIE